MKTILSDPGIDDIVALSLIYRLDPQTKNCLVSTFGNAQESITSRNAQEFISCVANNWQFRHGTKLPLNKKVEHPWPDYFHGTDAVWGIHPETHTGNIKEVSDNPENPEIISLAPMTELSEIQRQISSQTITVMGGVFLEEGNETKYAETNIAFDADAAAIFFRNITSEKVRVVPLDVTRKVYWNIERVNSIPETDNINIWIKKMLLAWFRNYDHDREKDFNLHDPLAVYLDSYPKQAVWKTSGVEVITKGLQRGRTIFSDKNPACEVALELINAHLITEEIYRLVFNL